MRLLIIDDDRAVCSSLQLLLRKKGYTTEAIHLPNVALDKIESFMPDLVLLDMNFTIDTSGRQGMKLLERIRDSFPEISVILMTGWATVQLAVEGMKLGARDFKAKPWDNKDLINSIESIINLYHDNPDLSREQEVLSHVNIIGDSQQMRDIMVMVERVAKTEASVLITGESGTGKELIAEAIHQASLRTDAAFVKVNLGGIPSNLFESEMFGHLKGSFTGAHHDREGRFSRAHGGTIFLDEIGELNLESQVKMLRVLQEKTFEKLGSSKPEKVDVRVISATNRNLENMCIDEQFREDLYYRINLINIHLPSLSQRSDDIPALSKYFLRNLSRLYQVDMPYVRDETFEWLSKQQYKGNIRQLKNIVERGFIMNMTKKELTRNDFLPGIQKNDSRVSSVDGFNLEAIEVETIKKALALHNASISASARALGITRSSLYRRLEKYNIPHESKI